MLKPIPGAWVFFRINKGQDELDMRLKYPDQSANEYTIPEMHLRNYGPYDEEEEDEHIEQVIVQESQPVEVNMPPMMEVQEEVSYIRPPPVIQEEDPDPRLTPRREQVPPFEYAPLKPKKISVLKETIEDDIVGHGLTCTVYRLKQHNALSHLRVIVQLVENNNIIKDDNGNECMFTTTIHNPLSEHLVNTQKEVIELYHPNPGFGNMNNKKEKFNNDIVWREKYKFFRHLNILFKKNTSDIYLYVQVLEKPEPYQLQEKVLKDTSGNYGGLEYNLKGWRYFKLSYQNDRILYNDQKNELDYFTLKLYEPPKRTPPQHETKVTKWNDGGFQTDENGEDIKDENGNPVKNPEQDIEIDIRLDNLMYEEQDLKNALIRRYNAKKPKDYTEDKTIEEFKRPAGFENEEEFKKNQKTPFLKNEELQFVNRRFEDRAGIDFYIDGLRFLPDRVTVTKVYMEVFNSQLKPIFKKETCLPEIDSHYYNPTFRYRRELRSDTQIDPTALVLLTVVTKEKESGGGGTVKIVGYAAVQLFINQYTKKQPSSAKEQEYVLYSGKYQLPLYSQQISRDIPFNMKQIQSHEKLPCASILVRINQAPLSDDNLRALSIKEFKDPKDWIRKGLFEKRPKYPERKYNTSHIKVSKQEERLFIKQNDREFQDIQSQANLLNKNLLQDIPGIPAGISDHEAQLLKKELNKIIKEQVHNFIDDELILTKKTNMIEMMYFAKYSPDVGINFSLDMIHQVPDNSKYYFGLVSLNPPGEYYTLNNPKNVHISCFFEMDSAASSPMFKCADPQFLNNNLNQTLNETVKSEQHQSSSDKQYFTVFKEQFNRRLCAFIDIKSITFSGPKLKPIIEDVGWTVIPLFSPDGYAYSSIFQLPLIKGQPPTKEVFKKLQKQDAWDLIKQCVKNKKDDPELPKLEWLEYTSIIIRTFDAQRDGHYRKPADTKRIDYFRYMINNFGEKEVKNWAYNEPVELKLKQETKIREKIGKGQEDAKQQQISEAICNELGLEPSNIAGGNQLQVLMDN